jgi:hypothetical protein
MEVPKWFDDPDMPRPCPCGMPPHGPMLLAELAEGGTIMMHLSCAQSMGAMEDDSTCGGAGTVNIGIVKQQCPDCRGTGLDEQRIHDDTDKGLIPAWVIEQRTLKAS